MKFRQSAPEQQTYSSLVRLLQHVVAGRWAEAASIGEAAGWDSIAERAAAHDVLPLAARAWSVSGRSPEVSDRWATAATAAMLRNLRMAALAVELVSALDGAGVSCQVLKGPPLAVQGYGSLALRESGDIDLLVDPEDVVVALQTLWTAGYRIVPDHEPKRRTTAAHWQMIDELGAAASTASSPALTPLARTYMGLSNEVTLRREGVEVVDLHWKLFRNRYLLSLTEERPAPYAVEVSGLPIPALPPVEDVCFLAVHGLVHGWDRLKWLVDIPMLLQSTSTPLDTLMDGARNRGVEVPVAIALHLSARMFGYPTAAELVPIRLTAGQRWIVAWAQDQLARRGHPEAGYGGKRRIMLAHVLSQHGLRSRLRAVEDIIVPPQVWLDLVDRSPSRLVRLMLVTGQIWADSVRQRRLTLRSEGRGGARRGQEEAGHPPSEADGQRPEMGPVAAEGRRTGPD